MTKGGKREGAGRKPRDPSAPLSRSLPQLQVRLSAELRERLKAKAAQLGMTEADYVRQLIKVAVGDDA